MDEDTVAERLYGLRPEEFTAARDEQVRAARRAGEPELARRVKALRRPTVSAWAGNLLVREEPDEVAPLIRLGEQLRSAHHDLDGGQLRELARRQHALIGALSHQARDLAAAAGHPLGEDAQREVEGTLHAVLADPDAARAWASGRLSKPLSRTPGFSADILTGPAGDGGRPARPRKPPPARADPPGAAQRRGRLARAREEARDTERELRAGREEADGAGRAVEEAERSAAELRQRVTELAEELARAERRRSRAEAAERAARDRLRDVDRRVRAARRRAEAAAARVERLTAEDPPPTTGERDG